MIDGNHAQIYDSTMDNENVWNSTNDSADDSEPYFPNSPTAN